MKKLMLVSILIILSTGLTKAQSDGIKFFHGTVDQLFAEAKKQDKLIFVDCYASWCGPCKWMAANVFTDPAVGEYFNKTFICYKLDMEKGEGPDFDERYPVAAYPTFMFIKHDGTRVYTVVGGREATEFIQIGKNANNPEKWISNFEEKYAKGERNPDFLLKYAYTLWESGNEYQEIANQYFATQSEAQLASAINMQAIMDLVESLGKEMTYLMTHRDAFNEKFGADIVTEKIRIAAISKVLDLASERSDPFDMDVLAASVIDTFKLADGEKIKMECSIYWYLQYDIQPEIITKVGVKYLETYGNETTPQMINALGWAFYMHSDDAEVLAIGEKWVAIAITKEDTYSIHDTWASLLYKLGDLGRAQKEARAAIELGKAEGEDVSATEELLGKILEGD